MERSSLAATVAERDALNQHLQVPNIIATGQEGLIRAFADVSVLEAGGLHSRQGELSARRKALGGILP